MFGLQLGRLGIAGSLWSERALWPLGASSPGLWIDPSYSASQWQDSAGTTALSTVGTVLDSSNPVGLILDRKGGATTLAGPGIHLSQSGSTQRPVISGRVNLLQKTEDFSDAGWSKQSVGVAIPPVVTSNATTAPDGSATADKVVFNATGSGDQSMLVGITGGITTAVGISYTNSYYLKAFAAGDVGKKLVVRSAGAGVYAEYTLTADWQRLSNTEVCAVTTSYSEIGLRPIIAGGSSGEVSCYLWGAQFNIGPTALPYQRVGAASDYTATGFPQYLKFDGVDDALSSATFPAGTLTSSMDCLIAVRRDSAASAICGFYESPGSGAKWFGACIASGGGPSSGVSHSGVFVDGATTGITAGELHTALTPGAWHILEYRALDLSTWTALAFGAYGGGFNLNGALGKILLFASGQDANRDKARARMAAYFGVTLP